MKIKACYVLSYKDPNYIRTRTLLDSLKKSSCINEVFVVKNTNRGLFRYLQTLVLLLMCRIKNRPDVYILGFRGQEIFLPVRSLTIGKPLIFDEFINIYDWAVFEHRKLKQKSIMAILLKEYNKLCLRTSKAVLEDTNLSAKYSADTHNLIRDKFFPVYVGADESVFKPNNNNKLQSESLNVFFYGSMLPLHGVDIILQTFKKLSTEEGVELTIVGGASKKVIDGYTIKQFIQENNLKNITHYDWVEFDKLPQYINEADVCLGGPFGSTPQGSRVITGKTYQFLAMAKPTVIGFIDEPNFVFKDKKNCLLVAQRSSDALQSALMWAHNHKEELDEVGAAGYETYKTIASREARTTQLDKALAFSLKS